jgi:hypothetical protein
MEHLSMGFVCRAGGPIRKVLMRMPSERLSITERILKQSCRAYLSGIKKRLPEASHLPLVISKRLLMPEIAPEWSAMLFASRWEKEFRRTLVLLLII